MLRPDQPLWLPKGSIRSILALTVTGAFLAGLIDADVALLVLGSYFVGRTATGSVEDESATRRAADLGNAEDPLP